MVDFGLWIDFACLWGGYRVVAAFIGWLDYPWFYVGKLAFDGGNS
jgi:hypothetical protein